ncbi:hypothetical protein AXF42_Ash000360 [Apostasia shenzhenica]|uniref:Lipase-like PAD4 n=1 Tax=Apostasia shenzhenica TaxID=1088818 RepID=A0A2I0AG84_9ASPA|nr:hypothetical protein AXF42_Ash000360 [Apostasia shenzhenica]
MEVRWEDERSMFETSHVLGAELASSPLLAHAWRQCGLAAGGGFSVEEVDEVLYVAFTAIRSFQSTNGEEGEDGFFSAVPLASAGGHLIFSPLVGAEDEAEAVLVQSYALQLFLSIYVTPEFQMLIKIASGREVVFTGHSLGGSIASLVTLYLLCSSMSSNASHPSSLLCITFGSPLLGNEALSRSILRERWNGKFCHVVSQHDLVPRLLFLTQSSITLLHSSQFLTKWPPLLLKRSEESVFRPFGSYLLCSSEGAVCIDNPDAVIRMLCLTLAAGIAKSSAEEEHLSYGSLLVKFTEQSLLKKRTVSHDDVLESNYTAGISLAIEASGIGIQQGVEATNAKECLEMSRKTGRSPNLNCANLSIKLAKVTPCRAQIEWYKECCDDDMGYYDAFKQRKAPKRDSKVNMNRIKLARFWDDLLDMIQNNQLPHDVHKRDKWVNAARFYQLLVEPLDIAEYYRVNMHKTKGHYLLHGRERRYNIFDKWWRDRSKERSGKENKRRRNKFAGLTQDPCFWAKVEEAREGVEEANNAIDEGNCIDFCQVCEKLNFFECYAGDLVKKKEVSVDVLAPNSSYRVWDEEWKALKQILEWQASF